MSCLPCSKVSLQEKDIVKFYQEHYKKTGKLYWVYRLSSKDRFLFIENAYFAKIRKEQIEPNFRHGAEYFRIDEFKTL